MVKVSKTHTISPTEDDRTRCGRPVKDLPLVEGIKDVTCGLCLKSAAKDQLEPVDDPVEVEATAVAPEASKETLTGEALIERKKLAGVGRSEEAGTAFGSKWTDVEREALGSLRRELGRSAAAKKFVEDNPHRTVKGALYQMDRHGVGREQA